MKTILVNLLAATFVLAAPPSIAENKADLAKLRKYKQCPRCDLRWVYLNSKDLRGVNLYRANLLRGDFNNSDLRGANLSYTNLTKAKLNKADLRGADLRGANLRDASLQQSDLRGADLRGADLRGAKLTYSKLAGAMFRGAKFCNTVFRATPRAKFVTRNDNC